MALAARSAALAVVLILVAAPAVADDTPLGAPAPAFGLKHWWNTEGPLEPADLRGQVVLVRFWTDTCPFCSTSAPILNEMQEVYGERGLRVVGLFHPKPPGDDDPERMRRAAERFGFTFPVGLDARWEALRRWWLRGGKRRFTSVSFLLDREGVVRWIHPGGEYHTGEGGGHLPDHAACNRAYEDLRATIERLLSGT